MKQVVLIFAVLFMMGFFIQAASAVSQCETVWSSPVSSQSIADCNTLCTTSCSASTVGMETPVFKDGMCSCGCNVMNGCGTCGSNRIDKQGEDCSKYTNAVDCQNSYLVVPVNPSVSDTWSCFWQITSPGAAGACKSRHAQTYCSVCTSDVSCDDGNQCTTNDEQPCAGGTLALCAGIIVPDGTPCTLPSTQGATCQKGVCTQPSGCTKDSDCDDKNDCTTDTCNPTTLLCEYKNKPRETDCGDGKECDGRGNCVEKCASLCSQSSLKFGKDIMSVKVDSDTAKLSGTLSDTGAAIYEGKVSKIIGSKTITLEYDIPPMAIKSSILVKIEGIGSSEYYFYVDSCHMKPGTVYTLKNVDINDLGYNPDTLEFKVKSSKTISAELMTNPCPGKCKTNADCWINPETKKEDPALKGDCSVCNKYGECQMLNWEKGCKFCDGKNPPVQTKKDYETCIFATDKEGYCVNQKCIEKTCENCYGKGFIQCPAGSKDCCPTGTICCFDNTAAPSTCCVSNDKVKFTCKGVKGAVPELSKNLCNAQECPPELPKKCSTSNEFGVDFCCGAQDECSVQHPLVNGNPQKDKGVPACIKEGTCDSSKGETMCPNPTVAGAYNSGEQMCCSKDEECREVSKNVIGLNIKIYRCALKQSACAEGQKLCKGTAEFESIRKCCNSGEVCDVRGNLPFCTTPKNLGITGKVVLDFSENYTQDFEAMQDANYVKYLDFAVDWKVQIGYILQSWKKSEITITDALKEIKLVIG